LVVVSELHFLNPSGHSCWISSENALQMGVPGNMHGPLVPLLHSLHETAGGNVVVVICTIRWVEVAVGRMVVVVVVVVSDSQRVIPAGHVSAAASSYSAQMVEPGYAHGPDVLKEHPVQSPATSIMEASARKAMLANNGTEHNRRSMLRRRHIDLRMRKKRNTGGPRV
jgi:hypothetical protein